MTTNSTNKTDSVSLDDLCARSSYITDIQQFNVETDSVKALTYWLTHLTPHHSLKDPDDISNAIQRSIADIDHIINDQINAIIHHKTFQALEASWRGLWFLVVESETTKNIKIKIMDISWAELAGDMSRSLEFDQSLLFRRVYNEEYGAPGGEPYGALIGDYKVSHRPSQNHPHDDISTLNRISQVAAAAFAPFICAASPELFGLDDYSGLEQPLNLHNIFAQKEYTKWRAFRDKPDSQFIGLTLPRILMRLPYNKRADSFKGMFFYEDVNTEGCEKYCWGNAAYAFGLVLIREFASVGWFGHIRGAPRNQVGGGLLSNLTFDTFDTDSHNIALKPVTDVIITDIKERELSNLGLIPLCQCYDIPFAAFYSNQSAHKPKRQNSQEAYINSRISAMLQHVLCGGRIAHYIKVLIRDKIGSFLTASDCEQYISKWLHSYTSNNDESGWQEQALYPLREASVQVKEQAGKSGKYICVIHLRPHYQLDNMVSELELITELTQGA